MDFPQVDAIAAFITNRRTSQSRRNTRGHERAGLRRQGRACDRDVDQEIPAEHYNAVTEVIGYIMRLNAPMRR